MSAPERLKRYRVELCGQRKVSSYLDKQILLVEEMND